jgi:hypothetical protein
MCGGGGPSEEEKRQAAQARMDAEEAKRQAIEERADKKADDISDALDEGTIKRGMRGGAGRRSLLRSDGAGFLGRFE